MLADPSVRQTRPLLLRIRRPVLTALCSAALLCGALALTRLGAQAPAKSAANAVEDPQTFFNTYCITCHNDQLRTAGLAIDTLDPAHPGANAATWEKVIVKLRSGSMPPAGMPRADASVYGVVATKLESQLDHDWMANPRAGRINAVHRLNRSEYSNAIRDLFQLDFDVKPLLPGDETADGSFDDFADVLSISTAHLERYMSVARQITRLATGLPPNQPDSNVFEIPLHIIQNDRMSEDLPFGSRGGMAIPYNVPAPGTYRIKVRLQRQYQDYLKGMGWHQQLDVRLDGKLLKRFTVGGEAKGRPAAASYAGDGEVGFAGDDSWEKYMQVEGDKGLEVEAEISAGPHVIGVTFVREMFEEEGLPQPIQRGRVISNDQVYMDFANVGSVQVGGPYEVEGPAKDTPSRRAIFVCYPNAVAEEASCANRILSHMARLAYRRPVTKADTDTLMEFFEQGREQGGTFDHGIQFALERMLVDPDFLLRVHLDPAKPVANGIYPLSDLEVASRLSFFLWSSVPDDRLLDLAEAGKLTEPQTLEAEARRMLADPRATEALTTDFAAQWLNLRLVDEVVVDPNKYPLYDLSLLRGFQTETEMFVEANIRDDRPVRELIDADYTFMNQRLAEHYGFPGIYGSRFRRVQLPNHDQRGGLLSQGALLATTSYPDRTSPVLRGKWLLNNMFGLPIPPPPPGVNTTLETKPGVVPKGIRERLAQHRTEPTCNSCHSVIDPLGFTLENFDVIGGWRTVDESGNAIDSTGTTANGEKIEGLPGLRRKLLNPPDQFPRTLTEKLMAYALGRRVEYYDQPSVRQIVRAAAADDYRWSSLIMGIVKSPAFLMRETRQETSSAAEPASVALAK